MVFLTIIRDDGAYRAHAFASPCLGNLPDASFSPESRIPCRTVAWLVGIIFLFAISWAAAESSPEQSPAATPKASPEPTPLPLANVLSEAQSTMTTLEEVDASVSRVLSSTDGIVTRLSELNGEIDPRLAEDTKLLTTSPSLDILYRVKLYVGGLSVAICPSWLENLLSRP